MKKPKPASLTSALLARLGEVRRGSEPGPPQDEEEERPDESDTASPALPGFGAPAGERALAEEPAPPREEEEDERAASEASARVSLSAWIERPQPDDEDEREEPVTARFRRPAKLPAPGIGRARLILVIVAFAVIGAALGFLFPRGEEAGDALPLSAESLPDEAPSPGMGDAASPADRGVDIAPLPPVAPRPRTTAPDTEIATAEARPPMATAAPPALSGAYAVQLFSARSEGLAAGEWAKLAETHARLFSGLDHEIVRAEIPGRGTYYRLRVGGFAAADEAQTLCAALKSKGADCLVVRR
jgi:cell division septation protein DedD